MAGKCHCKLPEITICLFDELFEKVLGILCVENLKDKSGVDKIIVKKQPYQLLNTSHEFFPSFQVLNFHKFDD